MAKNNAIERRIDQLAAEWNEFARNPDARLLRWLVEPDEMAMIHAFVDAENAGGDIPDLFVWLESPCNDGHLYGKALRAELIQQYDEMRRTISDDPAIPSDWVCPPVGHGQSGVESFLQACVSLRSYYEGLMEHLVIALMPQNDTNHAAWTKTLSTIVSRAAGNVRFIVTDRRDAPVLDSLCRDHAQRIVTVAPELDMANVATELVRDITGSGPGFEFRKLFMLLAREAGRANVHGAAAIARQALAIATQQQWPQLQVAVHMTLAAGHLAAGDKAGSIASYRQAHASVATSSDPAAPKLALQARMAEAGVLVSDQDFREAAEIYESLGPAADQWKNEPLLSLENWRMASFCHARAEQWERAWVCGERALIAGHQLPADQRLTTTLPYAASVLLGMTSREPYREKADELRQRLELLLGPEWRTAMPQEISVI